MEKLLVTPVSNLEDLKIGDIILYPKSGRILTAILERKPVKDPRYQGSFKSTRCKVCVDNVTRVTTAWDRITQKFYNKQVTYSEQLFNIEKSKFNKIRYISLSGKKNILKLL